MTTRKNCQNPNCYNCDRAKTCEVEYKRDDRCCFDWIPVVTRPPLKPLKVLKFEKKSEYSPTDLIEELKNHPTPIDDMVVVFTSDDRVHTRWSGMNLSKVTYLAKVLDIDITNEIAE